jgi:ABC-2 type transport system ATP-binding protein
MTQAPVTAEHLGQRYGRRWVFTDLSFAVERGIIGLLGPNGAGKTTLWNTVATLRAPAAGSLYVLGADVTRPRERREIRRRTGFLPQSFGYLASFTAREFVEYAAWLKGLGSAALPAAATRALEAVDLGDRAGSRLRELSGGMLRRVGIASAIVHEPELLILDEPTVGLDPEQRVHFRALLRELGDRVTVLVSTHLVEDVATVCGEVLVLGGGVIAFQGSPGALARRAAPGAAGDTALERGYSAVLAQAGAAEGSRP